MKLFKFKVPIDGSKSFHKFSVIADTRKQAAKALRETLEGKRGYAPTGQAHMPCWSAAKKEWTRSELDGIKWSKTSTIKPVVNYETLSIRN